MSGEKRSNGVPEIYSLLLGGLMASFVAVIVFTWMVDTSGLGGNPGLSPVLTGLTAAGVLMVAGMIINDRMPWLTGGFLFASGFTALWSVALSFTAEPKWLIVLALGVAIAMAVALGRWRFGRSTQDQPGILPSPTMPIASSTNTVTESSPILK
ncbi:MAG TPA: hypothetical protein VIL17_02115 [Coriobacteriia bacterium]